MDKQEFLKEQFLTLREEIKETKSRIFKLVGLAIVGVPAAHFLAYSYKLEIIVLAIPLLVIVVALLYMSENHALMRCGRYIKLYIESEIKDIVGWEQWLETPGEFQARTVDKFVSYCFYLLFFIYFAGSVFLADRFVQEKYGIIRLILLGVYIAIGIWFLIFLIGNIRTSTTTKTERI